LKSKLNKKTTVSYCSEDAKKGKEKDEDDKMMNEEELGEGDQEKEEKNAFMASPRQKSALMTSSYDSEQNSPLFHPNAESAAAFIQLMVLVVMVQTILDA
jgi:hypothetical protein